MVPALVQWVQVESKASVKDQKSTLAFNLAQAAVGARLLEGQELHRQLQRGHRRRFDHRLRVRHDLYRRLGRDLPGQHHERGQQHLHDHRRGPGQPEQRRARDHGGVQEPDRLQPADGHGDDLVRTGPRPDVGAYHDAGQHHDDQRHQRELVFPPEIRSGRGHRHGGQPARHQRPDAAEHRQRGVVVGLSVRPRPAHPRLRGVEVLGHEHRNAERLRLPQHRRGLGHALALQQRDRRRPATRTTSTPRTTIRRWERRLRRRRTPTSGTTTTTSSSAATARPATATWPSGSTGP